MEACGKLISISTFPTKYFRKCERALAAVRRFRLRKYGVCCKVSSVNDRDSAQRNVFKTEKNRTVLDGSVRAPSALSQQNTYRNFIGSSAAFESILETVRTIASRKCSVIITGETGTGKEIVARKIHESSDRCDNVFVPVDCTTLTGQLFESQLFGHVRGAFTGAIDNTLGFFRAANGGTIFLDEISEIPLELQAKLLRVLQEGMVIPIGSTQAFPTDVRVLSASNTDLRQMVNDNKFRADLFSRLNVVALDVPPLRQRTEDILLLARYFLDNQADFYDEPKKTLSPGAEKILLNYSWPGNIRELANAMERAYVLTPINVIETSALPSEIIMAEYTAHTNAPLPTLDDTKRKLITDALKITRGKKLAAARLLNIERRRLNRMIQKLNISVSQIKHGS